MLNKVTPDLEKAFDAEKLPFRRNLTHEELNKLARACSLAFKSEIHPQVIERIMHYCYYVERHMTGRAAGNIEDLIIRYLLRYFGSFVEAQGGKDPCHIEIGVLFGAATIFACHATRLAGKNFQTVAIDPFEGYYGQELDIITKLKVDEATFLSNLERFGFGKGEVRVLKGFSTDESIINVSAGLKALSLIIDGDHTYEGVRKDWLNFAPLVVVGGYVLLDDFNNSGWPGVTDFVNKEVLSNLGGLWEVALVYGNSLVLRRTAHKEAGERKHIEGLLSDVKDKEKELAQKEASLEKLYAQIKDRDAQLKQRDAQLKQRDAQISALYNSMSWKVTGPLRRIGMGFKSGKR